MKFILIIINVYVCASLLTADIIHVPMDTSTIQGGIYLAQDGDTVLVAGNTYYENINFRGKAITVASEFVMDGDTSHISRTVIDGSQPSHPDSGSVVSFISGVEDTNSVLAGFTITGGTGITVIDLPFKEKHGGGILIKNSGAKILNNKIINNHITADADTFAGMSAIYASSDFGNLVIRGNRISNNSATASGNAQAFGTVAVNTKMTCIFENNQIYNNVLHAPNSGAFAAGLMIDGWDNQTGNYIIRNNIIRNNKMYTASGGGGGMVIQNCSPLVYNNILSENAATSLGGGGIWIIHYDFAPNVLAPNPLLINNTIINNSTSGQGGGVRIGGSQSNAYLMNNIIWGNGGPFNTQIATYNDAGIKVAFSIVQGNHEGEGNIDADPLLVADSLTNESPAIGAGTLEYDFGDGIVLQSPARDVNGRVRPSPAGSMPDIGGWESNLRSSINEVDHKAVTEIPERFILSQNYPNPFNPITNIQFQIPRSEFITLKVYNILGEEVATVVEDKLPAGNHKIHFDGGELASGIYLYRIEAGEFSDVRKMILLH